MQCRAAKFAVMPRPILHTAKFFATPHLILGMLLHRRMSASKSQKLFSSTSDVVDAKAITTGVPTTAPSLVDDDLHVHKPVDLDNLGNGKLIHVLQWKPCLPTSSLLAHCDNPFSKASKGNHAELFPEKVVGNNGKQESCALTAAGAISKLSASRKSSSVDIKISASVSHVHSFGKHMSADSTDGE